MLHPRRRFLGHAAAAALTGCAHRRARPSSPAAELVVRGGVLRTGDPARPIAAALAVRAGTIVAVGSDAEIRPWIGAATHQLDLAGGTATAGLCDAHAHLVGLGLSLAIIDLRGAASIDEVIERLRSNAPTQGWVVGRGWDQNLWPDRAMPTAAPLTAAFPDRAVWLRRVDGHAGWGNARLFEQAGIDASSVAPAGGEILRDAAGVPTGVLVDAAMDLVPVPAPTRDQLRAAILAGQRHALARGLTGVHEMGIAREQDALYRELAASGELHMRIVGYAEEAWLQRDLSARTPDAITPSARYLLRGVKLYADGALGSRGAALLDDYTDRPGHRGLLQHSEPELDALCHRAVAGNWQIATHAIGDAAIRAVLGAYARALAGAPARDRRLRVEHAQIIAVQDIARFVELDVVASMQPTHATSDMPWVPERIGAARLPGAYAWRRFLDAKVPLAFGSDFPVERVDPTLGLYAAITREDLEGRPAGGWLPEQRLTLAEALHGFTEGAAYACHRERHLGRLAPGYRADLTCFAAPLDERAPRSIAELPIAATIVEGSIVHHG
jgi:predicted amidohydrolase YtcJ